MSQILVIIQDYRSLNVIEIQEVESALIAKLKLNKTFSFQKGEEDKYIFKQINYSKNHLQALIKVKVNKDSKNYSIFTQFQIENHNPYSYLRQLEKRIAKILDEEKVNTHVHSLVRKGKNQLAKKFGEEAVELVIEAGKKEDEKFIDEAADVFYYYLILLHDRGMQLEDILLQLKTQNRKN